VTASLAAVQEAVRIVRIGRVVNRESADRTPESGLKVHRGLLEGARDSLRAVVADHDRRWPDRDRVLDGWRRSAAIQRLAARPELREAASEFLGVPAFPFQTLNFRRGTAQALHADAVHFDTIPSGGVCGVWVALEDVDEHQGPLEYVAGSHTDGFTERHLRHAAAPFDDDTYERSLAEHLSARERTWFRAAAGDVLVWDSQLAHGGRPVGDPDATRWSQVIHFFRRNAVHTTPRCGVGLVDGELAVRDPVVDITSGRRVPPLIDGSPVDMIHLDGRRTILLHPGDPRPAARTRLRSAAIALRRRAAWRFSPI